MFKNLSKMGRNLSIDVKHTIDDIPESLCKLMIRESDRIGIV